MLTVSCAFAEMRTSAVCTLRFSGRPIQPWGGVHPLLQGQNNLSSHISLELLSRVEPAPEPIDAADEAQHA